MKRNTPLPVLLVLALAICALVVAVPLDGPAVAKKHHHRRHGTHKTVRRIAPGLWLTRIVDYDTPRRIFVLRADLTTALTFDVTLGGPSLPDRARTSTMAARAGAIAGVNGDFGSNSNRPTHPFAMDGSLVQTSRSVGDLFAVSKDEQRAFVGVPQQQVTLTLSSGASWPIDAWNHGAPNVGDIHAFTDLGGSMEAPPRNACNARLAPQGPPGPAASGTGLSQAYTVAATGCSRAPMTRDGGVVLSALPASDEATRLLSMPVGSAVTVTWTFGWPDVYDAIGGDRLLVDDSHYALAPCVGSVCSPNPRTAIGMTTAGKLMMVVVDGRQAKWSVGLSMRDFAQLMVKLGAETAINLDGGGSSTMVVRGRVINRPSDGFERSVTNAALILPGPDPNEP